MKSNFFNDKRLEGRAKSPKTNHKVFVFSSEIVQAPEIDGEDPILAAKKFQGDIQLPTHLTIQELETV